MKDNFRPGRYRTGDAELDEHFVELVKNIDAIRDPDLVFEMLASTIRLGKNGTGRGDLKLINSAVKELRHAMLAFAPYKHRKKVSIFGSARTPSDAPEYKEASEFAKAMAERDWMTITGAGPGIMTAGVEGAGPENSFGVNILLPFESGAPPGLEDDPKLVNFKYFFTRKLTFMKESHGYALSPGGFGTLDETFELLTLMQTGRTYLTPVVMLDADTSYWETWTDFVKTELGDRGLISPADMGLARICHTVEEAVEEICGFYRNYDSMRFVGKRLVMRLKNDVTDEHLAELNGAFADIVKSGEIERVGATDAEIADHDLVELPRIAFHFNQRSYGRLREMVDHINAH